MTMGKETEMKRGRNQKIGLVMMVILVVGLGGINAWGEVIYVKWDAGGANNGGSWENAYYSLQDGLDDAVSGHYGT